MTRQSSSHLNDDQLLEAYLLAVEDSHVSTCSLCRARLNQLATTFDDARDAANAEADAIFNGERLHDQRDRILRRLERYAHPAEVLRFPNRFGSRQAAHRLLGPAGRWIAGAAAAGLVAGLFLGFAVDRRVGTGSGRPLYGPTVATNVWPPTASSQIALTSAAVATGKDEQILTEIEDALAGPTRRVLELRTLDAMTTPPEVQEASFVPR